MIIRIYKFLNGDYVGTVPIIGYGFVHKNATCGIPYKHETHFNSYHHLIQVIKKIWPKPRKVKVQGTAICGFEVK